MSLTKCFPEIQKKNKVLAEFLKPIIDKIKADLEA